MLVQCVVKNVNAIYIGSPVANILTDKDSGDEDSASTTVVQPNYPDPLNPNAAKQNKKTKELPPDWRRFTSTTEKFS